MESILSQIIREVDAVTEEQLERVLLLDVQPGEEIVGSVMDQPYIHKIWALAHDYDRRSSLAGHAARFGGPGGREQLIEEAQWLEVIEHLVRELAWVEIRKLLPHTLALESIGLREGYVVVKAEGRRPPIGAALASLRQVLGKALGVEPDEEEEQEEKVH